MYICAPRYEKQGLWRTWYQQAYKIETTSFQNWFNIQTLIKYPDVATTLFQRCMPAGFLTHMILAGIQNWNNVVRFKIDSTSRRCDNFVSTLCAYWDDSDGTGLITKSMHTVDITKTSLYNFDPLKPHFYIVKLGFTGVYAIFLIFAQKHRLWYSLEPPRQGGSNEYPQSMFWEEILNISEFFI